MAKKGKGPDAAAELAEKLVRVLESQRALGPRHYPLPLARLAELTADANSAQVLAAVKKGTFKDRAILAKSASKSFDSKKALQAPAALADDAQQLAEWPQTLEFALRYKRTGSIHAVGVSGLGNFLAAKLQKPFKASLARRLQSGDLPPTVGYIKDRVDKLFLLEDLQPESLRQRLLAGGAAEPPPPSAAQQPPVPDIAPVASPAVPTRTAAPAPPAPADGVPADFAARFDRAFEELDRARGAHNFVSLADLRRALADCSREQFDAGLRQLRAAGRYGLSAAERLHGLGSEERAAGIHEAGALLLHVSRKHP